MERRQMARWAVLLLLVAVGGCSPFHKAWREAGTAPGPGITGRWEGQWRSEASGHKGRLRCVIEPLGERRYLARYHAVYAGILTFAYDVEMETRQVGSAVLFEGQADLGKMAGGVYHYTGRIDRPEDPEGARLFSEYRSGSDHGVFEMGR